MGKGHQLTVIDPRPTMHVPCGTCTECCKGDAIFLHPECGDDPAQYETENYQGRTILKHHPNGDCVYLDRQRGCTIHDRRPTICREMDCRIIVAAVGEVKLLNAGYDRVVNAARRLTRDGIGSAPGTAGD